jgi:hypothetical protein
MQYIILQNDFHDELSISKSGIACAIVSFSGEKKLPACRALFYFGIHNIAFRQMALRIATPN